MTSRPQDKTDPLRWQVCAVSARRRIAELAKKLQLCETFAGSWPFTLFGGKRNLFFGKY